MTTTHADDTWNWAHSYSYGAARIEQPGSVAELQQLVADSPRIRALGTRHSFSDVADGPGVLVSTLGLPADPVAAPDGRTITIGAGCTYATAASFADSQGLALLNMGSLPHISVGGGIATGTHGSGTALGSLSSAVAALEIVGADGELRVVRRGDADFDGSVIALGALGVVTRVTLDVQPGFRMRQDTYVDLPWSAAQESFADIMAAGYSVSLFHEFDGRVREVLVKTRIPDGQDDVDVPTELFGARLRPVDEHAEVTGTKSTPMDGVVGPWWDRLPHFRIDATPSVGAELQSEHFVAIGDAAAALDAIAELGDAIRPHLFTNEVRTVRGDDLWLSPTPVDSVGLAFTWKPHAAEVTALIPRIEEALAPFSPRAHWGKLSALNPAEVARGYARFDDFAALVARVDPSGVCRGPALERLLGAQA
ncbi:FAD-binding protein [Frigoribacterium sp. 2-23]|uniref:FAD-binding protein n=1 Tax=Frigoribacterium sp. 2-23 TaxID=3415006 RepID=UPI003C6EE3FF